MQQATRTSQPAEPAVYKVAQPTRHIDSLRPHPDNPREDIDPKDPKIIEMADSIERHGIIEPLVITPDNMLIAGHRRRVASRVAATRSKRPDLLIVPVTVRKVEPGAALELMLQENMQRESLTPLEEARAMYGIMDRQKLCVADLARRIAVPAAIVSAHLAILKLEPEVQRLYAANELPLHASSLLARVEVATQQINYAGMLARRSITLPKLKEIVHAKLGKHAMPAKRFGNGNASNFTPETETTATIPTPKKKYGVPEVHVITRAEAEAALNRVISRRISVHTVRAVLESVCCACGMKGQAEVCNSCPLPRFVLGIAGRVEL